MMALLFKRGARQSLEVKDYWGYTPLNRAVQRNCPGVVVLLLKEGADPNTTTHEGWNPLHIAAKCGHTHLFDPLLEGGTDRDAQDKDGMTPMQVVFERPAPVAIDPAKYDDYVGDYTPEGALAP